MSKAVLILGSNSDDKTEKIAKALFRLSEMVGKITRVSSLYETEPWRFTSDKWFINQVVIIDTSLPPDIFLQSCLAIENELGRQRIPEVRYSSRSIDIDILFYNSEIVTTSHLTIPHPRIHERNFVLAPLNELMPDFLHPVLQQSIRKLYKECSDTQNVRRINSHL